MGPGEHIRNCSPFRTLSPSHPPHRCPCLPLLTAFSHFCFYYLPYLLPFAIAHCFHTSLFFYLPLLLPSGIFLQEGIYRQTAQGKVGKGWSLEGGISGGAGDKGDGTAFFFLTGPTNARQTIGAKLGRRYTGLGEWSALSGRERGCGPGMSVHFHAGPNSCATKQKRKADDFGRYDGPPMTAAYDAGMPGEDFFFHVRFHPAR